MVRRVAVFTGNRAEYGMVHPVLRALARDSRFEYKLIISGAHLKDEFGRSEKFIEMDGFVVAGRVNIEVSGDDVSATATAIGSCISNTVAVLRESNPDLLVVAADRFEGFGALVAGTQMCIPTAHIEGGDYTEGGALDDSIRHAMTKLAHLHFTTNAQATERVLRLGEEEWRVTNVGYPPLDLVREGLYASPEEVSVRFGIDPKRPLLVFTQHSVSSEFDAAASQVAGPLMALEKAACDWGCNVMITYPNDDAGGRAIIRKIEDLAARKIPGIFVERTLGRHYYHGLLNVATACVGNSSSGIKETIPFGCPCVNIGSRQQGRLKGANVIEADYSSDSVCDAIQRAVFDQHFRSSLVSCENPYGAGNAGPLICDILADIPLDLRLLQKRMTY